jgi:AcrR family transcriptional regulator
MLKTTNGQRKRSTNPGTRGSNPTRRKNMKAHEREKAILDAAIRFFAENGFEAQTRELAKRAKTTHSAIFRHFPTKEALIERVYEHVFVSRWDPSWDFIIVDEASDLQDRLIRFYTEYAARIFDYDWVRIFIHSGLRAHSMTPRYLALIEKKIIVPVCLEMRKYKSSDPSSSLDLPVSEREREAVWGLHGQIFYIAIRTFIYGTRMPSDRDAVIADHVRRFIRGELSAPSQI